MSTNLELNKRKSCWKGYCMCVWYRFLGRHFGIITPFMCESGICTLESRAAATIDFSYLSIVGTLKKAHSKTKIFS